MSAQEPVPVAPVLPGATGTAVSPPTAFAALCAVAGAVVIGSSAVLIQLSGESSATIAFCRCAGPLPFLVAFAWVERAKRGPRTRASHCWSLLAGAFFGITLVLQNHAVAALGAGIATVLGNLQVLFVAFAGWALFAERLSRRYLFALPPALLGVVLVSGALQETSGHPVSGAGIALGVLTSAAYATFMLTMKRGQREGTRHLVGPLAEVTGVALVVAALYGLARGDLDPTPPWPAWGWLLLLALGPQLLGWLLITFSLRRLPVALAALILLLQPLIAVVLGAVVLGERLSAGQLAGCVVLLLAVLAAGTHARAKRNPPRPS